jgi:hypothetical protein
LDRGVIAPVTDSIVGLLTIDGVDEPIGQLRPALELRAGPRPSSAILFVAQRFDELEYRELGYEQPAAVVRGVSGDWLLLAVADGALGWTLPPEGSAFTPMAELVIARLNYLTTAWDRRVAATPGGSRTRVSGIDPDAPETSAEVHETREVASALWLRVTVHEFSPCEGDPPVVASGWVPAWTGGEPTAWYHSRGC